jgi:hypothetical protein
MKQPSPLELQRIRDWLAGWEALARQNCMRHEWIMLKLSCTEATARRLIELAEGEPTQ